MTLTTLVNGVRETRELAEGPYVIGRGAPCRIRFDDPAVSERHAILTVRGGRAVLEDLHSANGTYVNGEHSTTLTVSNLESWENGWGVYCTFYYRGQTARTTVAYMYITNRPTPTPQPQPSYGSMSGTAYKNGGWYSIRLQNGTNVSVSSGICKVEGQFYDGCSAIVYYTNSPTATNIYQVNIYGNQGLIVPDQPTHATGLIIPDGALGGYAGSQYYNNEPTEADQGGWAGMHYYDNMP